MKLPQTVFALFERFVDEATFMSRSDAQNFLYQNDWTANFL